MRRLGVTTASSSVTTAGQARALAKGGAPQRETALPYRAPLGPRQADRERQRDERRAAHDYRAGPLDPVPHDQTLAQRGGECEQQERRDERPQDARERQSAWLMQEI